MCEVTGARRNSADLAQSGLEIQFRLHIKVGCHGPRAQASH